MTESHERFVDGISLLVSNRYSTLVPSTTRRSAGLIPQNGSIIGCRIDDEPLEDLADALIGLPPAWKTRSYDTILSEFAVNLPPSSSSTVSEGTREHYKAARERLTSLIKDYEFGTPMLCTPRLRVGASEIIVYGKLNEDAFNLYNRALRAMSIKDTTTSWGRIVLAEATKELSDEEHRLTDEWIHAAMVPQSDIPLKEVLLSIFTVVSQTFTLTNSRRAAFPIS
jgi:hypothetical protein